MKLNNIIFTSLFLVSSLVASDFTTSLNYFGNLTGSSINQNGYEINSVTNSNINNSINFSSYSKLGGQLSIYNDNFSFMLQTLLYKNKDKNKIELTWLNVKYKLNNNFSIRLGRMHLTTFLNSNTLDVDYVHLWTKAPVEIYSVLPLRSFDGVEINYEKVIDNYYIDLKITPFGTSSKNVYILTNSINAKLKEIKAIALSIQKGNLIFNASYTSGKYNMSSEYITGLSQIIAGLGAVDNDVSSYSYDNKKIEFLVLGIDYNYNNFSFSSEMVKVKSDSLAPDMKAYYLMLSYRYKKFTPFVILAENKNDKDFYNVDNITIPTYLPPVNYNSLIKAKSGLESILYSMNSSQKTVSLGFRYDYKVGIAFKAQLDRISFNNYGNNPASGLNTHERYGFLSQETGVEQKPIYQLSVGLNFAF